MMRNCVSIDIEAALQEHLAASGYNACALPVPQELKAGCVIVHRVGGYSQSYVQDVSSVAIDAYGETKVEAMQLACKLTGEVRAVVGKLGGVAVYAADVTTLPYDNPDPAHYSLERATLQAQVITRVAH